MKILDLLDLDEDELKAIADPRICPAGYRVIVKRSVVNVSKKGSSIISSLKPRSLMSAAVGGVA